MQITSNTVSAVIDFYRRELSFIYSESELQHITRWVLQKQLGITATDISSNPGMRINESDMVPLEKMCHELKANRPIQYVLGEAEFYGLRFKVNESVLIPRPETEELIEKVMATIQPFSHATFLDIGTGSGCIPVAIKKNMPAATVFALDVSERALELARHNASINDVSVVFFQADILKDDAEVILLSEMENKRPGIIISNPPYVLNAEKESLHARVRDFEPHLALFVSDNDPLLFYRKIASIAKKILQPGGSLWFECHAHHAFGVSEMLQKEGFFNVKTHPDLSGSPRFSEAKWG